MEEKFDALNKELENKISKFEKKHGEIISHVLNENAPYLHNMKMKEEFLKNLEIDAEFENADLLDYLGYERIISCKNNKK